MAQSVVARKKIGLPAVAWPVKTDDFFPYVETETNLLAMDATDGLLRLQVSGPLSGVARADDTFYEIEVP